MMVRPVIKKYKRDEVAFAVSHHIANPVDAIDSFVNLAKRYLERSDTAKALECLTEADRAIEEAKQRVHDFRTGNISFE